MTGILIDTNARYGLRFNADSMADEYQYLLDIERAQGCTLEVARLESRMDGFTGGVPLFRWAWWDRELRDHPWPGHHNPQGNLGELYGLKGDTDS